MSENIFLQSLQYVTLSQVRQSSKIYEALDDETLQIYIGRAENIIKGVIWEKEFKKTPVQIQQAVLLLANCLYQKKDKKQEQMIKSEKRRGNQVVYATELVDTTYIKIHPCMNAEIYGLLRPYIQKETKNIFFRT